MARRGCLHRLVKKLTAANVLQFSLISLRWLQCFPYYWKTKKSLDRENKSKIIKEALPSVQNVTGVPGELIFRKRYFQIPVVIVILVISSILFIILQASLIKLEITKISTYLVATDIKIMSGVIGTLIVVGHLRNNRRELAAILLEVHRLVALTGTGKMWSPVRDGVFIVKIVLIMMSIWTASIPKFNNKQFQSVNIPDMEISVESVHTIMDVCGGISFFITGAISVVIAVFFYAISNVMGAVYGSLNKHCADIQSLPLSILSENIGLDANEFSHEAEEQEADSISCCCCSCFTKCTQKRNYGANAVAQEWFREVDDINKVVNTIKVRSARNMLEHSNISNLKNYLDNVEEKLFIIDELHERLNNMMAVPLLSICCIASLSTITGTFFMAMELNEFAKGVIVSFADFWYLVFLCWAPERCEKEVSIECYVVSLCHKKIIIKIILLRCSI